MITNHERIEYTSKVDCDYLDYRYAWENNYINDIVSPMPICLDIEANNYCNLRCKMCVYHSPKEKKIIEDKTVKSILHQFKDIYSVKLQWRGEPTLYKKLPYLVKEFKKRDCIEVMFNTNGFLLTEKLSKKLIDSGIDKIIISIDDYRKEQYEDIRINSSFDRVLDNIKMLQSLKQNGNPFIRVQAVVQNDDIHFKNNYESFWKNYVDEIGFNDCLDLNDESEDSTELINFKCSQLWQRLFVTVEGEMLPCCRAVDKQGKYYYALGNVKYDSIQSAWNSKELNFLREVHKYGCSHKIEMCRKCALRKYIIKRGKK